jgi:hypothetical protein
MQLHTNCLVLGPILLAKSDRVPVAARAVPLAPARAGPGRLRATGWVSGSEAIAREIPAPDQPNEFASSIGGFMRYISKAPTIRQISRYARDGYFKKLLARDRLGATPADMRAAAASACRLLCRETIIALNRCAVLGIRISSPFSKPCACTSDTCHSSNDNKHFAFDELWFFSPQVKVLDVYRSDPFRECVRQLVTPQP